MTVKKDGTEYEGRQNKNEESEWRDYLVAESSGIES